VVVVVINQPTGCSERARLPGRRLYRGRLLFNFNNSTIRLRELTTRRRRLFDCYRSSATRITHLHGTFKRRWQVLIFYY